MFQAARPRTVEKHQYRMVDYNVHVNYFNKYLKNLTVERKIGERGEYDCHVPTLCIVVRKYSCTMSTDKCIRA